MFLKRSKRPLLVWLGLVCSSASMLVFAAQDNDLIPTDVLQEQQPSSDVPPEKPAAASLTLENVFTRNQWRNSATLLLPGRQTTRPDWSNLTQLGLRTEQKFGSMDQKFILDTLWLSESADQASFKVKRDTHLYFKEIYFTVPVSEQQYLDLGRINLRSGVGTGFNPTDYFKTNALISRTSEDPSQLRTNRLGTTVLRWQNIAEDSSWALIYAPEISRNSAGLVTDASVIGQNMQRTNDRERAVLRYARTFANNLATDVSLYSEAGRPQLGLNLSSGIGQKMLLTFESNWARRQTLLDEAFANSSTPLSAAITSRFGRDYSYRTLNQTNLGGSYTGDNNITMLLEFHYNQAGLNRQQWRSYFEAAQANTSLGNQLQLLTVRQQSSVRQEPMSRKTLFMRITAPEIFHPDLTLTFLMQRDLEDQSRLFQLEAAWLVSKRTSAKIRYATFRGKPNSNFGSNALLSSVLMQINYAF